MQKNQVGRIRRIDWAGDYDSLKFSRAAYIEEDISGVFFRQMVVGLVSIIHCLSDIYYYRLGQLLQAEAQVIRSMMPNTALEPTATAP